MQMCIRDRDNITTQTVYRLIRKLREQGSTVLCVSHDMILLAEVVDRMPVSYTHLDVYKRQGQVIVDGFTTEETPVREMAKIVGMVFDNPEFQLSQMSVGEEIALGMESLGYSYEEMVVTIEEVLGIVGLSGLQERSPFGPVSYTHLDVYKRQIQLNHPVIVPKLSHTYEPITHTLKPAIMLYLSLIHI